MGGILRDGSGSSEGGVSGQTRGGQIGGIASELEQIACISPFTHRQIQSALAFEDGSRTTPSSRRYFILAFFLSWWLLVQIVRQHFQGQPTGVIRQIYGLFRPGSPGFPRHGRS